MKPDKKADGKVNHPSEACLRMAALIQKELLPRTVPEIAGADIAGWTMYSHMLGGDFFDYHNFSGVCCQAETKMKIVVGDACGHGLSSALVMTSTRSYLRARAMQSGDLPQVINDVNRLLCMDIRTSGNSITLFYASIDAQERKVEWVRAGHPPALLFNPLSKEFVSLSGKGLVLGVDSHHTYEKNCVADLPEGTIILIGSDGLWELELDENALPNNRFISDLVLKHQYEGAEILAGAVKDIVIGKQRETPLADDVTLLVAKFGS